MRSEGVGKAERYSSGGLVVGVIGLAVIAAVLGFGLFADRSGFAPWAYPLGLLLAAVVWTVLLRPAVLLHEHEVELRNMLHTRWIPFARISAVEVAQVTVVRVGEERYVGSGLGRSRRTMFRDERRDRAVPRTMLPEPDLPEPTASRQSTGWLIEQKLQRRVARAKELAGEPGEVRRTWAWPEIAVLGVLALATVVTALVA